MAKDALTDALQAIPKIVTEDRIPDGMLPSGFRDRYEVKSFRNAAYLLAAAHKATFDELLGILSEFEIQMNDILEGGGNKSKVAKNLEDKLQPLGWNETRISGDLVIRKSAKVLNTQSNRSEYLNIVENGVLQNFLDGHLVDFVKDRVAFDLEWNSKDQTFDRDLYAMRAFYDCGVIDVGIILTRSSTLHNMLADIGSRIGGQKKFKEKYGASTTWMGKLDYRINAGRAGGCPILALGFEEGAFSELAAWKAKNPLVGPVISAESLIDENGED